MAYTAIFRELLNLALPRVVFTVRNHRFRSFCDSKCALHGHISRIKQVSEKLHVAGSFEPLWTQ